MPGSNKLIKGHLTLLHDAQQKVSIKLDENMDGYGDVDFTTDTGFKSNLKDKKNWLQVRIIKSTKAFLFDTPEQQMTTKSYLVSTDIVKVLEKKEQWLKVEYNAPGTNKSLVKWIKEQDLYNIDPAHF